MEIKGKKILAKYIGEDGWLGFKVGHPYTIVVKGNEVCLENGSRKHHYANLEQFLDNWSFANKRTSYNLPIHKYDKDTGEFLQTYDTRLTAAKAHGVTRYAIIKALTGKTKACKGFIFSDNFRPNIFRT